MREFFKPWRRKMGCVTLVMACMFLAAWVRGTAVTDRFLIGDSKQYRSLEIREGGFLWGKVKAFGSVKIGIANLWTVFPKEEWGSALYGMHMTPANHHQWEWRWKRFGFDFGRTRIENGGNDTQLTLWAIPHWSITVSLTLVSLWLLLSKPKTSTQKNIIVPTEL